jgi:hypothetical protein
MTFILSVKPIISPPLPALLTIAICKFPQGSQGTEKLLSITPPLLGQVKQQEFHITSKHNK